MPHYIRAHIPGGTFFFTVVLSERRSDLLTRHVDVLRQCVRDVRVTRPFRIDAMVVLPEHFHAAWTLPPGDADFSTRMRLIKGAFSHAIAGEVQHERGVWQPRFWEHAIRDEEDLHRHIDYIHYNPVKHGHVQRVADWPYSTFHRAVAAGLYPPNWAAGPAVINDDRE